MVLSIDGTGGQLVAGRQGDLLTFEQYLGADIVELYHMDYSFKAVKTVLPFERQTLKNAQQALTVPVQYGAMPDLGRYSRPDGPIANWSELLPLGRIAEARAAQEEAAEMAAHDIAFVAEGVWEAGADAIDLDTSGAAGDADLLAALTATRAIRDRCPDMGIEMGMASEMVLGMHGELEWQGVRLAGLWPHQQVKLAEAAGATVFGPAVNVNSTKSLPWNLARTLTLCKPCCEESHHPRPHERRDGRGRRADGRPGAGRRGLPRRPGLRRHPEGGRLVGGRRRSARDERDARQRRGHGRDASRWRSGGSHADDPGHEAP